MMRISRLTQVARLALLPLALLPFTMANAQTAPVLERTSSALLTFPERDRALRVAIVFADKDDAVVETIVRFVDARGQVLKTRRGNLRDGVPLVVDLTRSDVGAGEVLVRAEVIHRLPGARRDGYPILVSLQSLSNDGTSHSFAAWDGGVCGCETCSGPESQGQHADCEEEPILPM